MTNRKKGSKTKKNSEEITERPNNLRSQRISDKRKR